eukprot:scaffold1518_cov331-Pavlova_lutheri.AAC.48
MSYCEVLAVRAPTQSGSWLIYINKHHPRCFWIFLDLCKPRKARNRCFAELPKANPRVAGHGDLLSRTRPPCNATHAFLVLVAQYNRFRSGPGVPALAQVVDDHVVFAPSRRQHG